MIFSFFYISSQVRKMADETGLDFTDQINLLESKYQQVVILVPFHEWKWLKLKTSTMFHMRMIQLSAWT